MRPFIRKGRYFAIGVAIPLLLGVALIVASPQPSSGSVSLRPVGPFTMRFILTPQQVNSTQGASTLNELTFRAAGDWHLTVLDGGEETGYFEDASPERGVVAGYAEWNEPAMLSEPGSEEAARMLPGWYLVPRTIPAPGSVGIAGPDEDHELIDIGERLSIDPTRLVKFTSGDEETVYDLNLGIPLLIRYRSEGASRPVFEVTSIRAGS